MKNKIKYLIGGVLLIVCAIAVTLFILWRPVTKEESIITVNIPSGSSKIDIVGYLKEANLVRSKYATLAYVFFSKSMNLQAGNYNIKSNLSTLEVIKQISKGQTNEVVPTVIITFVEGKKIVDYAKQIASNFEITYDDFISRTSDKAFLKELINHYDFLDESILNEDLYYPLEGYLAPDTYEFYQNSSVDTIIYRMLNNMQTRYNKMKDKLDQSEYLLHDILTMASIIEKEGNTTNDRKTISQVIYTRLNSNMALGMDVTAYYGVRKELNEAITAAELIDNNPYNTRNNSFKGLPAGPICNPSWDSINAALEPSDTDYVYFIADVDTGKVYFAKTTEEFIELKKKYIK